MVQRVRAWVAENGRAGAVLYMLAGFACMGLGANVLGAACLAGSIVSAFLYMVATF